MLFKDVTKYFIFLVFLIGSTISQNDDVRCIGSGIHCYCDNMCSVYGDCCYNSRLILPNNTITSCINDYYVIDKCNHNFTNENIKQKCEFNTENNISQLIFLVPVYGMYNNSPHVYRNVFCAICNGNTKYEFANITSNIFINSSLNKDINWLHHQFHIPIQFKRICHRNLITTCIKKSNEVFQTLCIKEPPFYITIHENVYRNVYCYLCNQIPTRLAMAPDNLKNNIIEAINFNQWCFEDCQSILKSIITNKSIFSNVTSSNSSSINKEENVKILLEKVVFVTFNIVSITTLLFMLFVFNCVNDQNNKASKITICLGLSTLLLTFSNVVFLSVDNPSVRFCFQFSIVFNYCFLSSFVWMSIFAVDVYQSLTSSRVINKDFSIVKSRKFKIYIVIGFIVPLVVSLTSMTIQLVDDNNVLSSGFGERFCFINRLIGGLVWLFIPLCICLVVNIIVCGCLYRFIYVVNQQTALVRNIIKARKENFILCMKLSILFGVIWIPGFVGIFFDNYLLKLVGGGLSGLHGALLSFCFIFPGKIRRRTAEYLRTIRDTLSGSIS